MRAPELPLYGMCRIETPAIALNSSPAMWYGVPGPDDAYESAPGFAFAAAISSASVDAGRLLRATRTRSDELIGATGTKSRMSWNGLVGISDSLTVCVFDISSSV